MSFVGGLRDGAEVAVLQTVRQQLPPSLRSDVVTAICPEGHSHKALALTSRNGSAGVTLACADLWLVADSDHNSIHDARRGSQLRGLNFLRLADAREDLATVAALLSVGEVATDSAHSMGPPVQTERQAAPTRADRDAMTRQMEFESRKAIQSLRANKKWLWALSIISVGLFIFYLEVTANYPESRAKEVLLAITIGCVVSVFVSIGIRIHLIAVRDQK